MVRRPRAAGAPKGTLGTGQAAELTLPGRCTPHCSVRRTKKNTTIIIKIEITSTRRGLAARPVPKGKAAVKGRHRLPGGAAPQPLTLSTSTVLQRGSSRRAGGAAASVGFSVLGQLCKKKEKPQGEMWQPAGLGVVTANEGEQRVPALSLRFGFTTSQENNEWSFPARRGGKAEVPGLFPKIFPLPFPGEPCPEPAGLAAGAAAPCIAGLVHAAPFIRANSPLLPGESLVLVGVPEEPQAHGAEAELHRAALAGEGTVVSRMLGRRGTFGCEDGESGGSSLGSKVLRPTTAPPAPVGNLWCPHASPWPLVPPQGWLPRQDVPNVPFPHSITLGDPLTSQQATARPGSPTGLSVCERQRDFSL